jgi:hypothetical protein
MSVNARVTGPAAIFGSSFSACRTAGTVKPKKQAAHNVRKMLAPMLTAAIGVPRHTHTMAATSTPQQRPSITDVPASRRSARKYQPKVGCMARSAWMVMVMD